MEEQGMLNDPGKPRIGLLPLMLEMYRVYAPDILRKQKPFIDGIADKLRGFSEVFVAPVCSTKRQTEDGVKKLESDGIDLLVVIFIAYATSISTLNPLLHTPVPLLLYSTSPKSSMAEGMTMEDILLNHGVHGYMDLANVLRRCKRQFQFRDAIFSETFCPDFDGGRIVMGHMGESNPAFGKKTVLRRKKFTFGKAIDPVITDHVAMTRGDRLEDIIKLAELLQVNIVILM